MRFLKVMVAVLGGLAAGCGREVPLPHAAAPSTSARIALAEGRDLFTRWCVACHGAEGGGDGINASRLTPPPADLASARVQQRTDHELAAFISAGARLSGRAGSMPPFGKTLSSYQINDLIVYLRTKSTVSKPALNHGVETNHH